MIKYQRMSKGRLASLVLALSMVAAATQVSATTDVKAYPATMCVPASSATTVTYDASQVYTANGGTVYCPVIKDMYGADNTQWGYVYVYDNSSAGNISCTLWLRNAYGGTGVGISDFETDATSGITGLYQLEFSVNTGATYSNSNMAFLCTFGTGGTNLSLRSYWIQESNTTN